MKVGYLIIGRLKSTRLPNKLLIEIKGKPVISHLLERLKLAKKVDEIIICTSLAEQDKPLANIAKENNVKCFFGDPDDVLIRMYDAANEYNLDYILTITADSPFVDPSYADAIVDTYQKTGADLVRQFDLPHGVFSYGIKVEALKKVIEIKDTSDTEVWGRYFTDTGIFNVVDFEVTNNFHKRPGMRMTLDYPEDLKFFEVIFDALYKKDHVFSLDEILSFLDANPDVVNINKLCEQKFLKKFKNHSEIKLKKKQNVLKAVVIGCGSIGQRHIKNLKSIGVKSIYALRTKKGFHQDLPDDLGVIELNDWNDIVKEKPDIAIISNPTSLHLETALKLIPLVKGVLMEKPLSNSLKGVDRLIKLINKNNTVLFMGHNLMFHPIISNIKELINSNNVGNIINIQCQVGHWLPDWHPYENYKKSYFAKKKLGGGVALTLIHEIHLAIELAGKPLEVCGMKSSSSLLDVEKDIDVISDIMIKHDSGCVSQIHLDYIQKPFHRSGLITFEQSWISYDFNEHKVVAQLPDNKLPSIIWSDKSYDNNEMYIKQLKCFIEYVEEGRVKHSYDIKGGVESLWVVDSYLKSDLQKKNIKNTKHYQFEF
jgi:spore coat polysaccharide biosynthesis protein SpsF